MGRSKPSSRNPSLRLLHYLEPYRGHLTLTAALMVVFALLSGISIGMISPFVKILFTPRPAVTATATPGPPVAGAPALPGGLPGLDAA